MIKSAYFPWLSGRDYIQCYTVSYSGPDQLHMAIVEGGAQLSGIAQKLANNKKSTIFI